MVLNCEIDLKSVEKYQNSIPVLKHDRNFNWLENIGFNTNY
jgi:predicted amidohydrolase